MNVGEERRSIDEIIYRARLVTQMGQVVTTKVGSTNARAPDRRWVPPRQDVWKINIDAAFSEKDLGGAWGFVVRDNHARAVLAGAGRIAVVSDALCAEATACIVSLQAAADQGMQHVMVETDSQILVKALQSDELDRAQGGVLFREAKFLMATLFSSVSVVHVHRSCNSVAHEMARVGRTRDLDHPAVWVHPLTDFVNTLLVRDSAEPQVA